MLTPEIFIIASEKEANASAVYQYLKQKHPRLLVMMLDTSNFPQQMGWKLTCNNTETCLLIYSANAKETISFEKIHSIWWWEPKPPHIHPCIQNKEEGNFAYTECCQMLEGLWYSIDCLWVNQPERQEVALNPLYQLQLAKICGFSIPDTIVSSYPPSVLEFWNKHPNKVSYIQLVPLSALCKQLQKEELDHIGNLALAPMIFQEIVGYKVYLKVIIIGNMICPLEIEQEKQGVHLKKYEMLEELKQKIYRLMKVAGLLYATLEIAIDSHKNVIFLGLDPCASFIEVERETGIPLTELMAQLLIGGKNQYTTCPWPSLAMRQ
jgi:hypothetical protein